MRRAQTGTAYSGTWEASFKDFFDGTMQSLIPNLCPALDWLKGKGRVRKVAPKGKNIIFATDLKLSNAFGYRGEGDYVPASDQVDNVQGSVPYQKGIKGMIGLTYEAMKFGRQGVGAFTTVETQEMKGAAIMMRKLAQLAVWGLGDGILAKVLLGGGGIAPDMTLIRDEDNAAILPGARWLIEGMKVLSVLSTAAYAADAGMTAALEVDYVDSDSAAYTDGNNNITANHFLVEHQCTNTADAEEIKKGSVTIGTASSFRGPQGLSALCDDGTMVNPYCGIDATTYNQWKAVVSDNGGLLRALTLDLFYSLYYKLGRKAGSFKLPLTGWMNPDVYQDLVQLLEHFLEFKPRMLEPGFEEFDVMIQGMRIPIKLDYEAPSFVYWLNPKYITWAEGAPMHLAKEHGSIWRFDTDRKDQYEAMYRWIFQIYSRNRNKHAILKDLDVDITSI